MVYKGLVSIFDWAWEYENDSLWIDPDSSPKNP